MKLRYWGALLTSGLAALAVLLAALQMLVLFHSARPGEQATLQPTATIPSAGAAPKTFPWRADPPAEKANQPAVKPPREPRPPARPLQRLPEFGPRPARRAAA